MATMMALHASFIAYAAAAEQNSTQVSTRMVVHRLLTLIRTSTAHGPLLSDATTTPPVTLTGNTITSHFIEVIDPNNRLLRVEYVADDQILYLTGVRP